METHGVKDWDSGGKPPSPQFGGSRADSPDRNRSKRRVEVFLARYGDAKTRDAALEYAGYAAFPLTLTTDLAYHLRERFTPGLDWYFASDVLLSGLCDSVGYDLYEMTAATRSVLLDRLIERWDEQKRDRTKAINELAAFVGEYILYRLSVEEGDRAKQLGDPTQWLALAYLRSDSKVIGEIKQKLLELLAQTNDPRERFRLSDMVMGMVDLLGQNGLEAIELRELVEKLENDEPIDRLSEIQRIMAIEGFPLLQSEEVTYKTIVFEDVVAIDELTAVEVVSVTIDRKGKEIDRQTHTVFTFMESIAEGVGIEMVAIPSGKFMMGSPKDEKGRNYYWEDPQHEVMVQPFFMSATVVTQAQWRVVAGFEQVLRPIGLNPSNFEGDDRPVEKVSWEEAEEFCLRLSAYAGREWNYQLPSEAQWEYACRAGTTTPFHFGETIVERGANYNASVIYHNEQKGKVSQGTTPVKKYLPNTFGLYDFHGNVSEWCQDDWHDTYADASENGSPWINSSFKKRPLKLLRGGSWVYNALDCRSAHRDNLISTDCYDGVGFRVVISASRILP